MTIKFEWLFIWLMADSVLFIDVNCFGLKKDGDYFTQCACAVISLVENRNRFFHHTTLTGFGYAIFVFFFSRFIVAIGENYLNSLYILTRIQNILTFNCCSMHLIWLSCCCSCDVLFIVRC